MAYGDAPESCVNMSPSVTAGFGPAALPAPDIQACALRRSSRDEAGMDSGKATVTAKATSPMTMPRTASSEALRARSGA